MSEEPSSTPDAAEPTSEETTDTDSPTEWAPQMPTSEVFEGSQPREGIDFRDK